MIWAILYLLGVPLWLCVAAIATLIFRNRALRNRPGDVPVRLHQPGKALGAEWRRGHALWVHDVFAFRGSPAAWSDVMVAVSAAALREPSPAEARKLRRLGSPVIATLHLGRNRTLEVATPRANGLRLLGPFAAGQASTPTAPPLAATTG